MQILMTILGVVLAIDALALITLVLMQQGRSAGLSGAIAGGAETFFGKKKAQSYEGKLLLSPRSPAPSSSCWPSPCWCCKSTSKRKKRRAAV